jgi:lysophospholipase L1-like esterase
MDSTKLIRYLALGDSYTIGEAVDASGRFPLQLASSLRKRNVNIAEPIVIAQTGWTTDELIAAIEKEHPHGLFDFVTLLIGVNNQYRGRSSEEYRAEFTSLLQRAIAFAGGKSSHVIVISIPDWGVMPFAEGRDRMHIAKEIDTFNGINWEESVRASTQYVDITAISREAVRLPELIGPDGLHPSAIQYKFWVELLEPKVLRILSAHEK